MTTAAQQVPDGRLVDNIVHFARALRKAGVKVGTAQVETAIAAVEAAGFTRREDFYHILRASFINRADHLEVYHQVFTMFWRDPEFLESMMYMMSPLLQDEAPPKPPEAARRRAEEALGEDPKPRDEQLREEVIEHAVLTASMTEVFKRMDFDQMSTAELAEAERAVRSLNLPVKPIRTRRQRRDPYGPRTDARATLRAALRRGGEIERIARSAPRTRPPDLVALCDISGSMSVYSRMVLRYLHAIAHAPQRDWNHVHAFTFGTTLTNVSRALQIADPDHALSVAGREATDWEGGTRIGAALEQFNKSWSRRVLSGGAVVLLITDGLERGELATLNREAARLGRSARQFVWLNPLLRWEDFSPRARGVRVLLEHVHSFHACHSIDSLQALSDALGEPGLRARYLDESRKIA